ncbi:sensor histidine kinase [Streptomyces sp. Vc74B-19]|uniref:sensor histidine kinase n=1 Tax=Streptomyces sp. Vc74B-19 TaxID=2741324 RepID=UPI001BFC643A|nr:histidine kinase [Streptomyces sp. Vc74B-19]MBT3166559.1 sensor histidine kinase [Streptomyces sp. Vc74B-19]
MTRPSAADRSAATDLVAREQLPATAAGAPTTPEPLTACIQRGRDAVLAWDRRRPLLWDLTFTGFWVTAALIDFAGDGWRNVTHNPNAPGALLLVLSLGLSVPLLWRRTHPVAVLLAMTPFAVVNGWSGAALQAALLQLVVVYHIALRRPLRALWWASAVMLVPVAITTTRFGEGGWSQQIGSHLTSIGVAILIGITVRTRHHYTEALEDRARRLEIERDQQARIAAAAERTRIAREMHDIIGHNLSVITGLADGGKYAAGKSPERAAQALDAIGTTSRQALGELRRLLDVLRDDDTGRPAERTPQPGLTDLDQLIEGVRGAGLPVHTRVEGRATLPPGRQLTVFRVVQEALTNTLKHAGPDTTCEISIAHGARGAVTVTITDTGTGTPPRTPSDGRGIPGMRERTALYGGTLEAGPRPHPEQGWRVRLHLPEESPQ